MVSSKACLSVFSSADPPRSPQVSSQAGWQFLLPFGQNAAPINPGPSLALRETVSDRSLPQEGQGGRITQGTGQRVLVIYQKNPKSAKAASSTELTAINNIMQVFSDLVIAVIQAKSQLSPYGALILKLNPCKQVG